VTFTYTYEAVDEEMFLLGDKEDLFSAFCSA
jgi:hypothetical protein